MANKPKPLIDAMHRQMVRRVAFAPKGRKAERQRALKAFVHQELKRELGR